MITTSTKSWVKFFKPNTQASLRLFCFSYAGGGALSFRSWVDSLPQTIEVCAVDLPGRGTQIKLPPFTKVEPLLEAIASALIPHLDRPFAFFGHSMGGLLSFELTRLLRRKYARSPAHLFISGRPAPQRSLKKPPIHALPELSFLEELRRLQGTPEEVLANTELMQLLLPILRADFEVLETYLYSNESPLNCPITVFGGWRDREVDRDELEAWREQTRTTFSLYMLPGDHFFIHSAQTLLLEKITEQLTQNT
jgi:medium-chain acyl-[acyl-carrier-protein] hydrolase